jgi:hypothetical protein
VTIIYYVCDNLRNQIPSGQVGTNEENGDAFLVP